MGDRELLFLYRPDARGWLADMLLRIAREWAGTEVRTPTDAGAGIHRRREVGGRAPNHPADGGQGIELGPPGQIAQRLAAQPDAATKLALVSPRANQVVEERPSAVPRLR